MKNAALKKKVVDLEKKLELTNNLAQNLAFMFSRQSDTISHLTRLIEELKGVSPLIL